MRIACTFARIQTDSALNLTRFYAPVNVKPYGELRADHGIVSLLTQKKMSSESRGCPKNYFSEIPYNLVIMSNCKSNFVRNPHHGSPVIDPVRCSCKVYRSLSESRGRPPPKASHWLVHYVVIYCALIKPSAYSGSRRGNITLYKTINYYESQYTKTLV